MSAPAKFATFGLDSLAGRFFLSLDHKGEAEYQGVVVAMVGNDFALLTLFSWLDGSETETMLAPLASLATAPKDAGSPKSVVLFTDRPAMEAWLERHDQRQERVR